MALTTLLPVALAAIALVLPGMFKSDTLPDWANGLIALAVVALFSYLTALADGRLIGGTFAANWAITAGIFGGLLAGPAQPLDQWLQSHFNLPFLKPTSASPVVLPAGSSPVPPRASAPPAVSPTDPAKPGA